MLTQDPITERVASAIGMTVEEAEGNTMVAARNAASVLRAAGFTRKYNHGAWDRGMRWFKPGSDVPLPDLCATSVLGVAIVDGLV
jgi:hypothetical protein